jgi:hypothetical protein
MAMEIGSYNSEYTSMRELSSAAVNSDKTVSKEDYFSQLIKNHPDVNIIEGNYSQGTTFGAKGQSNIMISPVILHKMEGDAETSAKYEKIIDSIPAAEKWLRAQCSSNGMKLLSCGFIVDANGDVSSYSCAVSASEGSQNKFELKDTSGSLNYKGIKVKQGGDKELQEKTDKHNDEKMIKKRLLKKYDASQIDFFNSNSFLKKV